MKKLKSATRRDRQEGIPHVLLRYYLVYGTAIIDGNILNLTLITALIETHVKKDVYSMIAVPTYARMMRGSGSHEYIFGWY